MNNSVLVAGGSGFIGSYVCDLLLQKNYNVICIDNLSTGNRDNIQRFIKNKNFTFYEIDICNSESLKQLEKKHISEIYHLASPAHVKYVTKFPVEAAITNSLGTRNLLDLAKKENAKLLFASSSEVYGEPNINPQIESYWGNVNSIGVRSGYDEGKRFGEALCMAYWREYSVPVSIARIFNTYGPNSSVSDSRVVPQFVMQVLKNIPISIHGDGKQTRSFCYVSDTANALIKIMESEFTGPFNVGNPDEYTILEIAKIIKGIVGSHVKLEYQKRPLDDPSQRKPDISLINKKLKWKPSISFLDGLNSTIAYYKKILPQIHNG